MRLRFGKYEIYLFDDGDFRIIPHIFKIVFIDDEIIYYGFYRAWCISWLIFELQLIQLTK